MFHLKRSVGLCDLNHSLEFKMFFFPYIDVYDVAELYYLHRLSANTLPFELFIRLVILNKLSQIYSIEVMMLYKLMLKSIYTVVL